MLIATVALFGVIGLFTSHAVSSRPASGFAAVAVGTLSPNPNSYHFVIREIPHPDYNGG